MHEKLRQGAGGQACFTQQTIVGGRISARGARVLSARVRMRWGGRTSLLSLVNRSTCVPLRSSCAHRGLRARDARRAGRAGILRCWW